MSWKNGNFNLVSIVDLMFSFTGILLFLIWGFASMPREENYREAKRLLREYYSFVVKKGKITTIKAKRDFIFNLKPMVFIVDSSERVKYLSPQGHPSLITRQEVKRKIRECIRINSKDLPKKELCGVVFMVPPQGFTWIKTIEKEVWQLLKNSNSFLPLSYIPMEEKVYRKVCVLWTE